MIGSQALILAHKDELLKEINHQLELGSEGQAEEDKFLLECNFNKLITTNGQQQEYWHLAIQTAWEACRVGFPSDVELMLVGSIPPSSWLQQKPSLSGAQCISHAPFSLLQTSLSSRMTCATPSLVLPVQCLASNIASDT
jgi:hypothetical protein